MENPKICKIFHDGRKDSLALHLFTNSCVNNMFDTSAVHMLNEHLNKCVEEFKEIFELPETQTLEEVKKVEPEFKSFKFEKGDEEKVNKIQMSFDRIGPPGLNKVLSVYGASHGDNNLKEYFHSRFMSLPTEYFL